MHDRLFCKWCWIFCLLISIVATSARADEYADMAALLTSPLYPTRKAARAGYGDDAIVLRTEIARRALKDMDASNLAMIHANRVHAQALAKLEACRGTLDKIRALDANTPDYVGVVDKALQASPALIRNYQEQKPLAGDQDAVNLLIVKGISEAIKAGANQWQLLEEWKAYRSHYAGLRATSLELAPLAKQRPCLYGLGVSYDLTDEGAHSRMIVAQLVPGGPSAKAGLRVGDSVVAIEGEPIVSSARQNRKALDRMEPAAQGTAVKLKVARGNKSLDFTIERSLPLNAVPDLLALSLSGSCDEAFDTDDLSLTNTSGMDLTNCTLLVTLATDTGSAASEQVRQHVHFVKHWPQDQKLIALYHNAASTRIARNESLPFIKRVTVQVYSDQFQGTNQYSYWNSAERKADLQNYCQNHIDFRGKYLAGTNGLIGTGDGLYQRDAGVRCWLHAVEGKAAPRLTLREVEVVLYKGSESISAVWEGAEWQGGGVVPFKTFVSPKFTAFGEPAAYEVRLRFHGTDYEHVFRFRN